MPDVTTYSDQELQNVIDNHRRHGATGAPLYQQALEEQALRKGKGLDFDRSLAAIRHAAIEGRFMSYGELAKASGEDWNKVRYALNEHLFHLVEFAHRRGWPLLSAIVVNQNNLKTGDLEPSSLRGFVAAARLLQIPVTDEKTFLREQQEKVFAWGKTQRGESA